MPAFEWATSSPLFEPEEGNSKLPKKEMSFSVPSFCAAFILSIEDVSINNKYEYENDFKLYSYSKSFSQLSMLAMTLSSSL